MSDIRDPRWQPASRSLQPRPRMRTGSTAAHSIATAQPWKFKSKSSTIDVREKALRKHVESKAGQREDTMSAQMSTAQALMDRRRDLPAYAHSDKPSVSRTSYNAPVAPKPLQDGLTSQRPANVYHNAHVRKSRKLTHFSDVHVVQLPPPRPPPPVRWLLPPLPAVPVMPSGSSSSGRPIRKKSAPSPFFRWAAGTTARKGTVKKVYSVDEYSRRTKLVSGSAARRKERLKRDYARSDTDHGSQQGQDIQPNVEPGPASYFMSPEMQRDLLPSSSIPEGITGQQGAFPVSAMHMGNATPIPPPYPHPDPVYQCDFPGCHKSVARSQLERHKERHNGPQSQPSDSPEGSNSNKKQTTTSHTPSYTFQIDEIADRHDLPATTASDDICSSAYRFSRQKLKYTISEDRTMDRSKRHRACFLALKQPARRTTDVEPRATSRRTYITRGDRIKMMEEPSDLVSAFEAFDQRGSNVQQRKKINQCVPRKVVDPAIIDLITKDANKSLLDELKAGRPSIRWRSPATFHSNRPNV